MSYAKITVGTTNKVRFYYLVETILAKVEKTSSYKAASTLKENGQADFDRLQASTDERELLLEKMEKALLETFDLLFHVIISDSVTHNAPTMVPGVELPIAVTLVEEGGIYKIKTVGTTDFTLIGASANTVGVVFKATGAGTGTGTVEVTPYMSYVDIKDNAKYRTINLDLIDKVITECVVDYVLAKWYTLKGLTSDAAIHMAEYQKGLADVSRRSLALRQM